MKRKTLFITLLIVISSASLYGLIRFVTGRKEHNSFSYEYTSLEKRDIENTVSSSGTLEPVGEIEVLAQMSGTVEKVYVNYNDHVSKNQPLLDLNTEILKIQEKAAKAALSKATATYEHTLLEYNNSKKLYQKNMISEFELHTAGTDMKTAKADVESSEASLQEIQIKLNQYALILSPIDGIILSKDVSEGDSVISGDDSTSLFIIAENLLTMEVQASVDELDISSIKKGQEVRFSVDSYPEEFFSGEVKEIRLIPESDDNVVTYTVIVEAENKEEKLLPGMTASIDFIVENKTGIYTLPNQALRFQPEKEVMETGYREALMNEIDSMPEEEREKALENFKKEHPDVSEDENKVKTKNILTGGSRMGMPGGPPGGPGGGRPGEEKKSSANGENINSETTIWYMDEAGNILPVQIRTGISDSTYTEIVSGTDQLLGKKIILKIKADGSGNS